MRIEGFLGFLTYAFDPGLLYFLLLLAFLIRIIAGYSFHCFLNLLFPRSQSCIQRVIDMALSLPMSLIVLGSSIAITAALTLLFRRRNVTIRPLPPGPGGFLLLGNINDMPKPGEPEWEHWLQHKDLYGT